MVTVTPGRVRGRGGGSERSPAAASPVTPAKARRDRRKVANMKRAEKGLPPKVLPSKLKRQERRRLAREAAEAAAGAERSPDDLEPMEVDDGDQDEKEEEPRRVWSQVQVSRGRSPSPPPPGRGEGRPRRSRRRPTRLEDYY
jgi:hypothetical protein